MNVEQKTFNIDQELGKLYKRRNKLMVEIKRKPQFHQVYVRYSNLMTKIREQLRLKRECQEYAGNKRLRDWLEVEHPEIYKKFFGSEGKEENNNDENL